MPRVALRGVDEEVGFDVAEDREAHRGARGGVKAAELRHRQGIASLLEGNVQVSGKDTGLGRALTCRPPEGRRPRCRSCCQGRQTRGQGARSAVDCAW